MRLKAAQREEATAREPTRRLRALRPKDKYAALQRRLLSAMSRRIGGSKGEGAARAAPGPSLGAGFALGKAPSATAVHRSGHSPLSLPLSS
jgi:hypothetical protein